MVKYETQQFTGSFRERGALNQLPSVGVSERHASSQSQPAIMLKVSRHAVRLRFLRS